MKIVATPSGVAHAGDVIRGWDDGVQIGPLGEELRVVPHAGYLFTHSAWCARDGTLYDRLYDPWARAFVWSDAKSIALHPQTDHFQASIGVGAGARTLRLVRIIALAWVEAPRSLTRLQACVLAGACEAESIVWVRAGVREVTLVAQDPDPPPPPPRADEQWAPLRLVGRSTSRARTLRLAAPDGYAVSARGWVRSPYGATTKGVRAPDQRLWVSLEDVGLVWVDEAVLCSFGHFPDEGCEGYIATPVHANGDVADNTLTNLQWAYAPVPHEESYARTVRYLGEQGTSIARICSLEAVQPSTTWSRVARVYDEGTAAERALVARLVPGSIVARVASLLEEHGVALRLRALVEELKDEAPWNAFDDGTCMGLARLARALAIDAELAMIGDDELLC